MHIFRDITAMMYSMTFVVALSSLVPALLDVISPLNESRARFFMMEVDFRIDHNEYYIPIFAFTTAVVVVGISIMVGVDSMHITCTTHACSLFAVIG